MALCMRLARELAILDPILVCIEFGDFRVPICVLNGWCVQPRFVELHKNTKPQSRASRVLYVRSEQQIKLLLPNRI